MIDLPIPLASENEQDEQEYFNDSTGSILDNLFSEEPNMGL